MKIEEPQKDKVKLESIEQGQCFKTNDNRKFIVTDERDSETKEIMCVNLLTGISVLFTENDEVIPITAKVVIEA